MVVVVTPVVVTAMTVVEVVVEADVQTVVTTL
jgi:hypothetical protein